LKRIILRHSEEDRIVRGHPWVYDNEIALILAAPGAHAEQADLCPGEVTDVESATRRYLGRAFVNPNSRIQARIYSPSKEGVDKGFFKRHIREAALRRSSYDLTRESARIVFAEADFLPGLIVDRFVGWSLEALSSLPRPLLFEDACAALGKPSSWFSVQFLCWAMDERRDLILDALEEVFAAPFEPGMEALGAPSGIVEKLVGKVRDLEGLPFRESIVRGELPASGIVIFENDLPFAVNLEEGQKTGHFLDQKENRRLASSLIKRHFASSFSSGKVLDACSYSGGFGIHAAQAGVQSVTCVDASPSALQTAKVNAELNSVSSRVTTVEANIFDYLRTAERNKERYDCIILDPPAFAKSKSALEDALRGYKEINLRAMKLLAPHGILVTCSCSQALEEARFKWMLSEAAADSGRRLVQIDFRYQSSDHPILVGYDESFYLKCGFYQALD